MKVQYDTRREMTEISSRLVSSVSGTQMEWSEVVIRDIALIMRL